MTCSTSTLRILTLIWDFIYAIFAFAIIGIGIYIIIKFDHFNNAAFVIISLGLLALLCCGFIGCAAYKENNRMLKIFSVVLFALTIILGLAIGFTWCFKTTLLINVDKKFDKLWREQPIPIKPGNASSHIASLERWLECCGNTGPNDYILPPYSCYNSKTDKLSLDGCRQRFLDFISEQWLAFNIFALIVAVVQIICAVLALVLANSILNRWRRAKYYPK